MKHFLYALCACLLVSCGTNSKPENEFLSPSRLPSQFFTIDPSKDTILRTSHASVLRIKAGTFEATSTVLIEIKEAFTAFEIFSAGLTTTSNGQPLRSGGMLYFNASSDGKAIQPKLPVMAAIPTRQVDTAMQLFKGEFTEDSTINWVSPEPLLLDTSDKACIEHGREIFRTKCGSCHSIFKTGTGPALKGFNYRGPWRNPLNIMAWINNPPRFMARDPYTQDLKNKFGSMMTAFPDLSPEILTCVTAYINSATEDDPPIRPVPAIDAPAGSFDRDCGYDTLYTSVQETYPEYDTSSYPLLDTTILPPQISQYDNLFIDLMKEKYEFNITGNGWYNIDAFLKTDATGIQNVKLVADLRLTEDIPMNVYVFIPSEKVMQPTYNKKGNQYYFDFEDGRIPLPLRERAIIFAFGSRGDKIVYGVTAFTIQQEQIIPVEIKATTKEGLQYILQSNHIDGVELEAIEKKMEILPVDCDDLPGHKRAADSTGKIILK